VTFSITLHSGFAAPADALELLWQRLDANHGDTRFTKIDASIRATWREDAPISMERDEREEIGHRAVFEIVCAVCASTTELESDWFAVSPLR
jgi:hypothetical protein